MSQYLVGSSLYFQRPVAPEEALSLIRSAIEALGEYHGVPLRAYLPEQADMLARLDAAAFEETGYLLMLNHETLAREMQSPTFLVNMSYLEPSEDIAQIQIYWAVALEGSALARVWRYALDWMRYFVNATSPSLAVLTAVPDIEDHPDFLPTEAHVHPGEFPLFFGPWNYFDSDRLNAERRLFLQLLPVTRSEPFGAGWLLQVVRELTDRPPVAFLEAIATAPNPHPVEYRQPEVLA